MPFAGLGIVYLALAITCAIHAVRSGQPMYWLFVVFAFPLLGSVIYIFAVWLPRSRLERGAMKAVSAAVHAIDPTREVREARADFDDAPTAQNQMRLAAALLEARWTAHAREVNQPAARRLRAARQLAGERG
jgi:hypothetical protein